MVKVNENYLKLKAGYLFPEISKRVSNYTQANSSSKVIKLGIGDVTEPLPKACINAMREALNEMGTNNGFKGYGPEQGYGWLREKISVNDFISRGCQISPEEIFVSDGSKCDSSNILDILGDDNLIAVTDPVYPVYVDTSVMMGQTGEIDSSSSQYDNIVYMPCTASNGFFPDYASLPRADVVYLCSPK